MASQNPTNSNVYAVGYNQYGQLGVRHKKDVTKLTQLPKNINITAIDCLRPSKENTMLWDTMDLANVQ